MGLEGAQVTIQVDCLHSTDTGILGRPMILFKFALTGTEFDVQQTSGFAISTPGFLGEMYTSTYGGGGAVDLGVKFDDNNTEDNSQPAIDSRHIALLEGLPKFASVNKLVMGFTAKGHHVYVQMYPRREQAFATLISGCKSYEDKLAANQAAAQQAQQQAQAAQQAKQQADQAAQQAKQQADQAAQQARDQAAEQMRTHEATTRVTVPPQVMEGLLASRINLTYPPMAKMAHMSGTVVLHALISETGMVERLDIVSTSNPMFNNSALDGVKQWRWKPYLLNGIPHAVDTTVKVNFAL
jgi:TonB family protein